MSASEKLNRIVNPSISAVTGARSDPYAPHWPDSGRRKLWDASMELLAVVEAAENFEARFEERFINGMAKPLNDAIAALERKLT